MISFDRLKLTNNRCSGHQGQVENISMSFKYLICFPHNYFSSQLCLHSMHKYQPIIHISCNSGGTKLYQENMLLFLIKEGASTKMHIAYIAINFLTKGAVERKSFQFPQTMFTTVTAYQNQQVCKLKVLL